MTNAVSPVAPSLERSGGHAGCQHLVGSGRHAEAFDLRRDVLGREARVVGQEEDPGASPADLVDGGRRTVEGPIPPVDHPVKVEEEGVVPLGQRPHA